MSNIIEDLNEELKKYECEHHVSPSLNEPHGCTDCQNLGLILDSKEAALLYESYKAIIKLRDCVDFVIKQSGSSTNYNKHCVSCLEELEIKK